MHSRCIRAALALAARMRSIGCWRGRTVRWSAVVRVACILTSPPECTFCC